MIFKPDWRIILNCCQRENPFTDNETLLFRFGFFRALETDDQGNRQGEFLGCLDDAFGDVVAAHDAAKNVNKYALHFRIREKNLECLLDRLGRSTAD
jgi:hypothetical protein